MRNYRIVQKETYVGVAPVGVWVVQVRHDGFFFDTWHDVKAFTSHEKAQALCDLLNDRKL